MGGSRGRRGRHLPGRRGGGRGRETIGSVRKQADDIVDGSFSQGSDGSDEADLEMEFFVRGPLHATIGLREDIDQGEQFFYGNQLPLGSQDLQHLGRNLLRLGRGVDLLYQQQAKMGDEIGEEFSEVSASFALIVQGAEDACGISLEYQAGKVGDRFQGIESEDIEDVRFSDLVSAEGHELVQHRLGIPHASIGSLCDGKGRCLREGDPFVAGNEEEMLGDDRCRDPAQVEPLAAGEDSGKDFVRLRRREDELHVGRGLFEGLQECVERLLREHVDLIDVVDFELTRCGGELHRVPEIADVVDTPVAGSIDLEDVETAALGNLHAGLIVGVEINPGAALAVQGFCQDSRGGGLPGAAGADEEIGVGEAILFDRVLQSLDDVVLSQDVVEGSRPVFPGEYLVVAVGVVTHERPP